MGPGVGGKALKASLRRKKNKRIEIVREKLNRKFVI